MVADRRQVHSGALRDKEMIVNVQVMQEKMGGYLRDCEHDGGSDGSCDGDCSGVGSSDDGGGRCGGEGGGCSCVGDGGDGGV